MIRKNDDRLILEAYKKVINEDNNKLQALNKLKKTFPGKENEIIKDFNFVKIPGHLPRLVDYYITAGVSIDDIKSYYNRWLNIQNRAGVSNNINRYKGFHDMEQVVDATVSTVGTQAIKQITDAPVYSDQNIDVYIGSDKARCIKYGQGNKYSFCISRDTEANLFNSYRFSGDGNYKTIYFVYFKTDDPAIKGTKATEPLVVILVSKSGKYTVNWAKKNDDIPYTVSQIEEMIPALKGLLTSVFKFVPHSHQEIRMKEIMRESNILNLKSINDQLLWMEGSRAITLPHETWEQLKNPHAQKWIELGKFIPMDIVEKKFPRHVKRYKVHLKRKLDDYIEEAKQSEPGAVLATPHEEVQRFASTDYGMFWLDRGGFVTKEGRDEVVNAIIKRFGEQPGTYLYLHKLHLTEVPYEAINALPFQSIKLELSNNNIKDMDSISKLTNVWKVFIAGNPIEQTLKTQVLIDNSKAPDPNDKTYDLKKKV